MRSLFLILLMFAASTSMGCRASNTSAPDLQIESIDQRDPAVDAADAIRRKDFRFVSMHGYHVEMPGITEQFSQIESTYGVRFIHGINDTIPSAASARGEEYAAIYNQILRRHLRITNQWKLKN